MFIYSFLWNFMQRLAMFLAYVYISELTGQRQCVFLPVKSIPRPAASLLGWTPAPMTTLDRHGRLASTSQGDTAPSPISHHRRREARRSRTVRLRSLVSPFVRSGRDVPPRPALPPRRSVTTPDRPPPGITRNRQRVSAGLGGQLRRPRRQRHRRF